MSDDQSKIIFDEQTLDDLREAIGEQVKHIVSVYLEDVPLTFQHLRAALNNLEYETIGRLAHSLKSSSANIGAPLVAQLAAKLEQSMKDGLTDKPEISEAINNLENAFRQVRPMLIKYIG